VKDELGVARAYMELWSRTLMDPSALAAASINYWVDSMRLWHSTWMKMMGQEATAVAEPAKGDARFRDADWSGNFVFDYIKQSYLIAARHIHALPAPVRAMLRAVGVSGEGNDARGAALASYLLFEAPYTRELIALGEADTMARRDDVLRFFRWPTEAVARSGPATRPGALAA